MIAYDLNYDMRAPAFGSDPTRLYGAAVEQCAWADKLGFRSVVLSEHHAAEDGYLPSPIVLASAIAGATDALLLRISLLLLPLYDPLKAAEDLAVLDLVSNGRMRLTVGGGYRPVEYEQFGLNIRRRPSLMEEAVETLKQAWTGEPFEFRGRTVLVRPRPAQRPRPTIAFGGASPAAAKRAARIGDDFQPLGRKLYDIYLRELEALGKPPPPAWAGRNEPSPLFVHIAEDPDRYWALIAPHALHESNSYGSWASGMKGAVYKEASDAGELRASGQYVVLTPDQFTEWARTREAVSFKPLMGGLDPDVGWSSLQLFADKVLPSLKAGG